MRLHGQRDLAAGGDQNHIRLTVRRVCQDVGAAGDTCGRGVFAAIERRQRLPRQDQHRGLMAQRHDVAVGFDDLVGVAGPQRDETRNRAERCQVLDGLMGRAVLAVAHRVVREDEDRRQLHQRGEPDRRPRVVAEDEEGRAKRPQLRQRQPVHDRAHRVLADAEVQIPAAGAGGLEISGACEGQRRLVRRTEVGRATQEPRDVLREDVQNLARGLPARQPLRVGREHREVTVPALRQLTSLHPIDLRRQIRVLGSVRGEELRPCAMRFGAALPDAGSEVLADTVRDEERRVLGPAVDALREADFLVTERLAVGGGGALSVGRAVADAAVEDDERGPALGLLKDPERVLDAIDVVGVADAQHVPPVGQEAGRDVLGERQVGAPLDGDVVVVEDPTEVIQAQVAGERCRLGADAFHQAAVAADRVRCCSRRPRSPGGCNDRQAIVRRSPCRRWSRCPARAGRWWSPHPKPCGIRDAREPCCQADGSGGCHRA